ncbi:hypothetical protein BH09MYX1_BH09MYX1_18710 [soil metagenome]
MLRTSLALFIGFFLVSFASSARAANESFEPPPPVAPPPESGARPPAWGARHPFALTLRAPARVGEGYVFGGVGGQVRFRPFERLRVDLFFDNFFGEADHAMRHDHEVGGTIQYAIVSTPRFVLYPILGACAMWAMLMPNEGPGVSDIRFGLHGGIGAEVALGAGFSLALNVEAVPYLGHEMRAYDRTAFVDNTLKVMPMGQANLGFSYWF